MRSGTGRAGARVLSMVCALGAALGCSSSEEQPPAYGASGAAGEAETAPPTPAETQAAMQAYLESQAPGEHHEHLAPLVGSFDAQVKHWMDPALPPEESTGVLENTWALGGRFVLSQFEGVELGQPFQGLGLLGYDTVKHKHVGTWADSMGTFVWPIATGECSDGGEVITMSRVMTDPMTGGLVKLRDVTSLADPDRITYEIFATHPGRDEVRMLQATYVRRSAP
jgi:hypothetical protein